MEVTAAAVQMACGWNREENLDKPDSLVRAAARQGANVVLHYRDLRSRSVHERRANWGVFRDRRPDACGPLLTLDGFGPLAGQDQFTLAQALSGALAAW